jgi:hypothetical protein
MKFHVIPETKEQSIQIPPISGLMVDRASAALLMNPHDVPIILRCDFMTGEFPGSDPGQRVFLLNDVAFKSCDGLGLQESKLIGASELPEKYGLMIGPSSANYDERKFE